MSDEEMKNEAAETVEVAPEAEQGNTPVEATRKDSAAPADDVYLSLRHVDKVYDNNVQAVFDFNLDVKKHEFVVLVGPSGCGKSTTIRMIAGLENISSGDLYIGGKYANDLSPKERDIAMVFQNYALYPQMSVYDNMAFGLKMRHIAHDVIDRKVREAAEILELTKYLDRKPRQLSGGQKQRVALGRAIVRSAKIFLMDEPLSNLDAKLRVSMRAEIVKLHKTIGATTIYVTHDQTEAMTMATKIVVLKDGRVQQIGSPEEIYSHPANLFVATFIGSPAMNIWDGTLEGRDVTVGTGNQVLNFQVHDDIVSKRREFYQNTLDRVLFEIYASISRADKAVEKAAKNLLNLTRGQLKSNLSEVDSHQAEPPSEKATPEERIEAARLRLKAAQKKCELALSQLDLSNWFPKRRELTKNIELVYAALGNQLQRLEQFDAGLSGGRCDLAVGLRPEEMEITTVDDPREGFESEVVVAELLGASYYLHFNLFGKEIVAECHASTPMVSGQRIKVIIDSSHIHVFDKVTQLRID